MSLKNHQMVNGRLPQTDKRFSALKQTQKEKINSWLFETYQECFLRNGKEPDKKQHDEIVDAAYRQIEAAGIWIPYGEVARYYGGRKAAFRRRICRTQEREQECSASDDSIEHAQRKDQ